MHPKGLEGEAAESLVHGHGVVPRNALLVGAVGDAVVLVSEQPRAVLPLRVVRLLEPDLLVPLHALHLAERRERLAVEDGAARLG